MSALRNADATVATVATVDCPRLLGPASGLGSGLAAAIARPARVVELLDAADVRGRGGANFPTAAKWRLAMGRPGPRVVVGNGGEHEPGSVKDAYLLSAHPDMVLEGLRIAAVALGAGKAALLLAGRLAGLAARLEDTAEELVKLVPDGPPVDIVVGPDDYLVGEETALIEVLEGKPARPRFRPPLIGVRGYWSYPTVVQNVETLANVAWVMRACARHEPAPAVDTFLWTVWGSGREPVIGESRFGTSVGALLTAAGVQQWQAVTLGGYSGGVLRAAEASTPLIPAQLAGDGLSLGSASFRVIGENECLGALAEEVLTFFAQESCGQCVPCSSGLHDSAAVLGGGASAQIPSLDAVDEYMREVAGRGACRLPDGASATYRALWARFSPQIVAHHNKQCSCHR
jgi:NADH-quinone oxidoreductase subunit F